MATKTEQHVASGAEQAAKTSAKTLQGFFTKFNNDWVMNFAAALAFNLITAILPILIGDGPHPASDGAIPLPDVHGLLLRALLGG